MKRLKQIFKVIFIFMFLFLFTCISAKATDYTIDEHDFMRTSNFFVPKLNDTFKVLFSGGGSYTRYDVKKATKPLPSIDFTKAPNAGSKGAVTFQFWSITGNEKITVTYTNVGKIDGRKLSLQLIFTNFIPTDDYTHSCGCTNPAIQIAEDMKGGYSSVNLKSFNIEQKIIFEDTGELVPIDKYYMSFASLNIGEGVTTPSNANTYRIPTTRVGKTGTNQWEGLSESNSHDNKDHELFHENTLTVEYSGNVQKYRAFQSSLKWLNPPPDGWYQTIPRPVEGKGFNSDLWAALSFAPLAATAPYPEKYVLDGNTWVKRKESI